MKKSLWHRLSAVSLAVVLAFGIVSLTGFMSNGDVGHLEAKAAESEQTNEADDLNSVCVHVLEMNPAKEATCTEDGNIAYYVCSECEKVFADEAGTIEIALEDTVIPAKGHQFGEWTITKEPTYDAVGQKERECSVCHVKEQTEIPVIEKAGWMKEDGNWYYYQNGNKVTNTWKQDSKGWCYLEKDGRMITNGWAKDSKGWCWLDANGYWVKDKWILSGGQWYYLKPNGYMAANEWAKDSKGWCWMNGSGRITKSKWIKNGGYWYYLKPNGYMAANEWAKDSKGWCWMNGSGRITKSKWIKSKNIWYYLNSNGYMVTGEQVINKTTYYFKGSGAYIGRKYPSLSSVGISYNSTVNAKVDAVIKDMLTKCLNSGVTFDSDLDQYQQACVIINYVGATYSYGDGSYTAESMIDKGYGTCYAYADLTYCIARKVGISNSWMTVAGRNVDHDGQSYGSLHKTVVAQINGSWYDLDSNLMSDKIDLMFALGIQPTQDFLAPEKISKSYAQYLMGKTNSYSSIH